MKDFLQTLPGYFISYQKTPQEPTIYSYRYFENQPTYGISINIKSPELLKRAIEENSIDNPSILRVKKIDSIFEGKKETSYFLFSEKGSKKELKFPYEQIKKLIKAYPEEIIEPKPLIEGETTLSEISEIPLQIKEKIQKYIKNNFKFYANLMLQNNDEKSISLVIDSGIPHLRIHFKNKTPTGKVLIKNNKPYLIIPKVQVTRKT